MYEKMFEAFWLHKGGEFCEDVMFEVERHDSELKLTVDGLKRIMRRNLHKEIADEIGDYNELIKSGYMQGAYKLGFSDGITFVFDSLVYRDKE